jgi:hypothetical protein
MDPAAYDQLRQTLADEGADAAIERLCAALTERREYDRLFDALILRARRQFGMPPLPDGASEAVPAGQQAAFEEAVRAAARKAGQLHLDAGDVPNAWRFFGWLGEPGPVAAALDQVEPGDDERGQQLVDIAFHHRAHPKRGFEWILRRYGLCSAITTLSSQDFSQAPDVLDHGVRLLLRALHEELVERLRADIARQEGAMPEARGVSDLIAGRDWLFADGFPHVDVSHLQSVVQMSLQIAPCDELRLARELCRYGRRLGEGFQPALDVPFEQGYADYDRYLAVLSGDDVEGGLAHFRAKADAADPEADGSLPVEVLVNLLLKVNRPAEALAAARAWLRRTGGWPQNCPGPADLCRRAGDFAALADVARERGDPVHFLAGLLAARP